MTAKLRFLENVRCKVHCSIAADAGFQAFLQVTESENELWLYEPEVEIESIPAEEYTIGITEEDCQLYLGRTVQTETGEWAGAPPGMIFEAEIAHRLEQRRRSRPRATRCPRPPARTGASALSTGTRRSRADRSRCAGCPWRASMESSATNV
jgi:hypothetical protein